ncbi:hypothetical protein H4219_006404, partial [Mycoemilia scoparia]
PKCLQSMFEQNVQLENVALFSDETKIADLRPALDAVAHNLKSLELDVIATSEQLKDILDSCPNLEALRLENLAAREIWKFTNPFEHKETQQSFTPTTYPKLKSLSIVTNKIYGVHEDYRLSYINHYFPNLESLELSILCRYSDTHRHHGEEAILQHGENIFMYKTVFNHLQNLKISFLSETIIDHLETFFPHLTSLEFIPQTWSSYASHIENKSIRHLLKSSAGSKLTSLKTVYPYQERSIVRDYVFIDADNHPTDGLAEVTPENKLPTKMNNLTTLDVCNLLMTAGSFYSYREFPKLQNLKIYLRSLALIKKISKSVKLEELVVLEIDFIQKNRVGKNITDLLTMFPKLRVFKTNANLNSLQLKALKTQYPYLSIIIDRE